MSRGLRAAPRWDGTPVRSGNRHSCEPFHIGTPTPGRRRTSWSPLPARLYGSGHQVRPIEGVPQVTKTPATDLDAVVIGAGFGGIYMLKKLRDELGLRVRAFDKAGG